MSSTPPTTQPPTQPRSTPAPGAARQRPGPPPATTREKTLEVAETLFAARGFAGVGMREVATRVGIGKSSLFHHFATKLALYEGVLLAVVERIAQRLEPALDSAGSPAEKLDRLVDAVIDAAAEHPNTARLLLRTIVEDAPVLEDHPSPTPYEAVVASLIERLQSLLLEGAEQGVFRRVAPGEVTQQLIGMVFFHFASGEFGEVVTGRPLFSAEAIARFKREVRNLLHGGLALQPAR